jgi:3-methyladenine DNA glycosylase/8-oxoguanine DNA glycosylase
MAGLPFDWCAALEHLGRADARFGAVLGRAREVPLVIERRRSPFEYLLQSVIYQQLSGRAAATIHGRFLDLFPARRPTPERLLALRTPRLRSAGVSAGKARALRDLASRAAGGEIPGWAALARLEDEEIIARLTVVHGIGRWTAEMLLIFQLGRPDVLPVGDLGVRKGFARLAGSDEHPTPVELHRAAEPWRPYRSVGSWCCWRANESAGPEE